MMMITDRHLYRRGLDLGEIDPTHLSQQSTESIDVSQAWQQGSAILLPGICATGLSEQSEHINASNTLYEAVLNAEEGCEQLLDAEPYALRLAAQFESLGASLNEGDDQEIETVLFDAVNANQEVIAEDLWMKASWLSFHDEDASLRFRFSFGVDLHEDVAADKQRQLYAAQLTEAVFPESQLITHNAHLHKQLRHILSANDLQFVERIIYFNAPNGGAYLHHDRERGHAGVVFAQLSGETFWLALSKQQLIKEITAFIQHCAQKTAWPSSIDEYMQKELQTLAADAHACAEQLESFANTALIHLINETQAFVQHLIQQGYGYYLQAGDVLLLPQEAELSCCWHSVFCVGEEAGQALSFAIRAE